MVKTADQLKQYFLNGSYPTESQFGDLIDTMMANAGDISMSRITGLADAFAGIMAAINALSNNGILPLIGGVNGSFNVVFAADTEVIAIVVTSASDCTVTVGTASGLDDLGSISVAAGKHASMAISQLFFLSGEGFWLNTTAPCDYKIFKL